MTNVCASCANYLRGASELAEPHRCEMPEACDCRDQELHQ